MELALFMLLILAAGHGVSEWCWHREGTFGVAAPVVGPAERLASSLGTALVLWIGLNWLLNLGQVIDDLPLLAGAAALAGTACWGWKCSSQAERDWNPMRPLTAESAAIYESYRKVSPALVTAICLLLGSWLVFVLWRGTLVPVATHDALSYHFPKAVLISRAHAYTYFPSNDPRLSCQPPNFEFLLADFMLLQGNDWLTTSVSTLAYGYFVLLAMATAERWWNGALPAWGTGLLVAGLPVALLHSGGQKNDILMVTMVMAGVLWGARWAIDGRRMPLLLCILSLVAGCGTKPQGGLFLVACLPMLLWGLVRRFQEGRKEGFRAIRIAAAASVAGFLLLGGMTYLIHASHTGTILGYPMKQVIDTVKPSLNYSAPNYGEWANLWMYPYLLFTIPFSSSPQGVWVPWLHQIWFWPKYEIYMSHYGIPLTLCLLLIPWAMRLARRDRLERDRSRERLAGSLTFLLAVLMFLPIRYRILGAFNAFPRYLLFVPVLISGWSLAPLLRHAERAIAPRPRRLAMAGMVFLLGAFLWQGLDMAYNDRFLPLRYVLALKDAPALSRTIYFTSERAASVVDRLAGPDDVIAMDSGFDGWIYPAYGKDLTRPVRLLLDGPGPVVIPPDAKWVVIDRSYDIYWEHPDFKNMGQFWSYLGRGPLTPEDTRVLDHMKQDAAFRQIYSNKHGQYLFQRIANVQ